MRTREKKRIINKVWKILSLREEIRRLDRELYLMVEECNPIHPEYSRFISKKKKLAHLEGRFVVLMGQVEDRIGTLDGPLPV